MEIESTRIRCGLNKCNSIIDSVHCTAKSWLVTKKSGPSTCHWLVVCLFTSLTHRFFSESNLFPSRRPTKDTVGTHAEYTSSLNQNSATPSINAHIAMVKGSLYIYVLCTYVDISIYLSINLFMSTVIFSMIFHIDSPTIQY